MSLRLALLWLVLIDFTALTLYAVMQVGYLGFFELALANWATRLLSADLVIALGLCAIWMVDDARKRGLSALPYLVITLLLGSAGPLAYLIRREWAPAPALAEARSST